MNKKALITLFVLLPILFFSNSKAEDDKIQQLLTCYWEAGFDNLPYNIEEKDLYCLDGVLFGKDVLLLYPEWKEQSNYTIPEGIDIVFDFAFAGNEYIETVIIPDSCHVLGASCFAECISLSSIRFGNYSKLSIIDDYCFCDCYLLNKIDFPDSIYMIGEEAFSSTALSSITFPEKLVFIGDFAFAHTVVTTIDFSKAKHIKHIGDSSFEFSIEEQYCIILPFDADPEFYLGNTASLTNDSISITFESELLGPG